MYKKLQLTLFLSITLLLVNAQVSTNNWYVGNTQSGEWIKYKKVWLSSGNYRFTARVVGTKANQAIHLELNNQPLQNNVAVPINPLDTFNLVHIGHTYLTTGYYDMKLVFETGNVNCDMFFVRKDESTSPNVLPNDIAYSINRTDGMHIAPITAQNYTSASLSGIGGNEQRDMDGNVFNQKQVLAWYKQQNHIYTPVNRSESMDQWVSELVASKSDFLFMHGRGQVDFTNDVEDRDYNPAEGHFDARFIEKFIDAVNRSPYAKGNIKLAYFQDNPIFTRLFKQKTGKLANWGDVEFQSFVWNYAFKPWFESVPADMLYYYKPGVVPVQIWTPNVQEYDYKVQDSKILEFYTYIKNQMISTFGITPYFCFDKGFFGRDPRLRELNGGLQCWFGWSGWISSMDTLHGKTYAFTVNGKRFPLANTWKNDWDPVSNTGTFAGDGNEHRTSALMPDGTEAIRQIFNDARAANAEWIVEESWDDWAEGTTWYRSDHPEYAYPNQYVAINREFADRNSGSIVLEAEDCDEFSDKTVGNSGGAYRYQWYTDKDVDLDIYRPLHKLSDFKSVGKPATALKNFSAGFNDTWGFDANGKIYAHEVDGTPVNWLTVSQQLPVKDLAVGDNAAWAIGLDRNVYMAKLTNYQATNASSGWTNVSEGQVIKDLDMNMKEVWAVNTDGKVLYCDLFAKGSWVQVPGKMRSITADDEWIWGFTSTGRLARMSEETKAKWDSLDNPYKLTKIDAGSGEVWGVNAKKEVYRISSSGEGSWQLVAKGYTNVSVGYEFAWLSDSLGNMFRYKMSGFESKTSNGIAAPGPATKPVLAGADTAWGKVGNYFDYEIAVSGYHKTFAVTNIPGGLKLNKAMGDVEGFPTVAGTFNATITVTNEAGSTSKSLVIIITSSTAYKGTPLNIPGKVEAEDFDNGGPNLAYYDNTPTNVSGKYRTTEAVDIETCSEGGFDIGNVSNGEWMNYAVNVTAAGSYTLQARVASPVTSGVLHVELDGENISGTMKVPNTGGYQAWQSISVSTPLLSVGKHNLRIILDYGGFNLNYLSFNNAPVISSSFAVIDTVNTSFKYTISASGTPTSYGATGLPSGLNINASTGVISGTPTVSGKYNVSISATNSSGTDTKTLVLTISPAAPVITSVLTATGGANNPFSYNITASNTPTNYNATNLPAGLTVNTTSGAISGTPVSSGISKILINASNLGGSTYDTLVLTVTIPAAQTPYSGKAIDIPGRVESEDFDKGGEGLGYHDNDATNNGGKYRTTEGVDIQGASEGGFNLGWTNTGEWMHYTVNVLSAKSYTMAVRAAGTTNGGLLHVEMDGIDVTGPVKITSSGGNQVWKSFSVATKTLPVGIHVMRVVLDAAGYNLNYIEFNSDPLVSITSQLSVTDTIYTPFKYTISNVGGATSFTATGLPAGLTLNTSSGVISGSPTVAGIFNVSLSATNGVNTDSKSVTINIKQPIPVIMVADTIYGETNHPFSLKISASDSAYKYDATNLPVGLIVNSETAVITGTPATPGIYQITLFATNRKGSGLTQTGGTGSKNVIFIITVGNVTGSNLSDAGKISGILVYPNPSVLGESINIHFVNQAPGRYHVKLLNYLGQSVFQTILNVTNGGATYHLSQQIPEGYYMAEIKSESGNRFVQKIVIQ